MTTEYPDITLPTRTEIYPLINDAIMSKRQQQWNRTPTGRENQYIQPNVRWRAR